MLILRVIPADFGNTVPLVVDPLKTLVSRICAGKSGFGRSFPFSSAPFCSFRPYQLTSGHSGGCISMHYGYRANLRFCSPSHAPYPRPRGSGRVYAHVWRLGGSGLPRVLRGPKKYAQGRYPLSVLPPPPPPSLGPAPTLQQLQMLKVLQMHQYRLMGMGLGMGAGVHPYACTYNPPPMPYPLPAPGPGFWPASTLCPNPEQGQR